VNSRSKSSIGTQRTASVERGSVTATVSAQGNVTAQTVDNLAFVNSGTISGLSIKVGDTVKGRANAGDADLDYRHDSARFGESRR
jgi:multidrug efflux pump subunit AcrA (membrane-fusion protein)